MKKLHITDMLFTAAFGTVLAYGLSFAFLEPIPAAAVALACCALTLMMAAMFAWPKAAAIFAALLGAAALFLFVTKTYAALFDFAREYADWIGAWVPGRPDYATLSAWLLSAAITPPVFLLIRYRAPVLFLLATGALIFYGQEYLGYSCPFWLFFVFLLLVLVLMCVQSTAMTRKRGRFALCALPVCAVLLVVGLSMPSRGEGMGQEYFNSVAGRFQSAMDVSYDFSENTPTEIGSTLGGPFVPSNEIMLYLDALNPMYLRGGTAAVYDGRRWLPDPAEDGPVLSASHWADVPKDEVGVTFNLLWRLSKGYLTEESEMPYDTRRAVITLQGLTTDRVYTVPGVSQLRLTAIRTGGLSILPDDSVRTNFNLARGDSFEQTYNHLLPKLSELEEYYRLSAPGFADELLDFYDGMAEGSDIRAAEAADFRQKAGEELAYVRATYMGLPENLPERLYTLAGAVTAAAENDYDRARAIERYLSSSFSYNTDMPYTPEGQDFVDYFIFTLKEGYCTYFATAMTVLCRAAGLPARYVEGFAPTTESTVRNGYLIRAKLAHAWTEVYFEGVGWLSFEPTATFNTYRGSASSSGPPPQDDDPSPEPSEMPAVTPEPSAPPDEGGRFEGGGVLALTIISVILTALVFARIAVFARKRRFEKKLSIAPYSADTAARLYRQALDMFKKIGLKPKPDETLREFAERADRFVSQRFMGDLTAGYEKTCFSREGLSGAESAAMRDAVAVMRGQVAWLMSEVKYFVYRYVLGTI